MSRWLILLALLSAFFPASVLAERARAQEQVQTIGGIESVGVLPPRVEIVEMDSRGAIRRVTRVEGSIARKLVSHLADALALRHFEPRVAKPVHVDGAGRELDMLRTAVTASLNGDPRQDISAEAASLALHTGADALLIANYYQERSARSRRGLGFNPFGGGISIPSSSGKDAVVVIVVIVVVVAIVAVINQLDFPSRPTYESLEVGLIDGKSGEVLWAKRTAESRPALIRTIATTLHSLPWKRIDHASSPIDL